MRILDLLNAKYLTALYETGTAVHLIGPPGGGKSTIACVDIPRILSEVYGEEFGVHKETVTTLDAPDARGFLFPAKDKDGRPIAMFTRSGILPSREYLAAHPRGVMVLDERSHGQLLVQNSLAPGVLEKEFGNEKLPDGWWVISTSNRMEDRAGVVRPPMQLINREVTIPLQFDITSSAVWWEEKGLHPMGIAFAKSKPGVFAEVVPKDPKPYCTPRSYTEAWKFLARVAGTDAAGNPNMHVPSNTIVQEIVAGMVGDGAAAETFAFVKVADQLPTIEQVLADPTGCKAPERLDAGFAAVQMCIHHAKPRTVDKLWAFIERLPKELQTSAALSLIERNGGALLNTPALGKWISENRALIISSTRD